MMRRMDIIEISNSKDVEIVLKDYGARRTLPKIREKYKWPFYTLGNYLRNYVDKKPATWDHYVPKAMPLIIR